MTTITFQDLKDIAPWCSIAVAIVAALIAWSARLVAAKALRLNQQVYNDRQSNFTIELNQAAAHRQKSSRYLFFNIDIHNLSDMKNSFSCRLELTYKNPEGTIRRVIIDHDPENIKASGKQNLSGFDTKPRLEEKHSQSGWLCFIEPANIPVGYSNLKYELIVTDNHHNTTRREVYLLNELV
jgi:hypothetical protein